MQTAFCQTPPNEWLKVLRAGKTGKEISIVKQKNGYEDQVWLVYVGQLKGAKGKFYRIMTMEGVSGPSMRGSGMLMVFDGKNRYLGRYNYGAVMGHGRITRGFVIVSNGTGCDKTKIYKLSFRNGIPKQFFLECKNGFGDIFNFEPSDG